VPDSPEFARLHVGGLRSLFYLFLNPHPKSLNLKP
jgi:hypothetical protein